MAHTFLVVQGIGRRVCRVMLLGLGFEFIRFGISGLLGFSVS